MSAPDQTTEILRSIDEGLLQDICERYGLELVVIFGSRARGQACATSDCDVGVLRKKGIVPAGDFLQLAYQLSQALKLGNIDLVDLRRASPLLKYEVSRWGKPIYQAEPSVFVRFRVLAWKLYQDDRYDLRRFDAVYIQRSLERLLS
jgi:predicted nucleotidyltransferase